MSDTNEAKRVDTWKIAAIACVVVSGFLTFNMFNTPPEPVKTEQIAEARSLPSLDQATMQEAKETYKPKSIRENLARAKEVMRGFKEQPGEEPMDRMTRMNEYIKEATKEDVKMPNR